VHAGIADGRMWDDQVDPFAEAGWTVVRADLPGSARPRLPRPSMERPGEFNRVVLQFLARLDRSP
jgi:pimeloyl-ACP methyl ester carboxylesterase